MTEMCSICWTSDPADFFPNEPCCCIACILDGWILMVTRIPFSEVLVNIAQAEGDH